MDSQSVDITLKQVHASGDYELLDTSCRGGVSFMALGSLYGGTKVRQLY